MYALCLFLFTIRLFFPVYLFLTCELYQSKLLLFYPRLILLSPSCLFLLLYHMLFISLMFSVSFFSFRSFSRNFPLLIFPHSVPLVFLKPVNFFFLYWFSKYRWKQNKMSLVNNYLSKKNQIFLSIFIPLFLNFTFSSFFIIDIFICIIALFNPYFFSLKTNQKSCRSWFIYLEKFDFPHFSSVFPSFIVFSVLLLF